MTYTAYQPNPKLQSLIDVYWQISGHLEAVEVMTLLPDGGVNLVVNLGEDILSTGFEKTISHEGIFLVGPMMKTDIQLLRNEALLFGIRFKPGAFSYFYKQDSLHHAANLFHEFSRTDFPDLKKTIQHFAAYFDQFYLDRLSPPKNSVLPYTSDITQNIGSMNVEALAKKHFISERQLERLFQQQVGVSPKNLAALERFHKAFALLQAKLGYSIEKIAWHCGYYDHAHLTNDFKRFTGQPPTAFILSDFSKKIADESL